MSATTVTLKYLLLGDASSASRAMEGVSHKADETGGRLTHLKETAHESFKDLGKSLLTGAGIVGLGELGTKSVEAADQLEGANIKIEHVFGESADAVKQWAQSLGTSFGISQAQAESTAGSFAQILNVMGKGPEETAAMSEKLTELAADMARFNNANPAQVLTALQSGLRGRATMLRQYGVDISNAAITEEAYREGLAKQGKPLSDAAKTQAAYNLILKQTKNQEGAVKDSSKTLAQQKQILTAQVQNLEAKLGTALIPVLTKLFTIVTSKVVPAIELATQWIGKNRSWLLPLAAAIGAIVVAWKIWNVTLAAWNLITKANPILLIISGIIALGVALVVAYKKSQTFREIVNAAFKAVKIVVMDLAHFFTHDLPAAFHAVVDGLHRAWNDAIAFLKRWGPLALAVLAPFIGIPLLIWQHFSKIRAFASTAFHDALGVIRTIVGNVATFIRDALSGIRTTAKNLISGIGSVFRHIGDGLSWAWNHSIGPIIHAIESAIQNVINLYNTVTSFGHSKVVGTGKKKATPGDIAKVHPFAQGTGFFAGGMALVGDRGPELLALPVGSQVRSASVARSQLSQASGTTELHIHVETPTLATQADIGRAVKTGLEYYVNQGGKLRIAKAIT